MLAHHDLVIVLAIICVTSPRICSAFLTACDDDTVNQTAIPSAFGIAQANFCVESDPPPYVFAAITENNISCLTHTSCGDGGRFLWWWESTDPRKDRYTVYFQVRQVQEKGGGTFPITIFQSDYQEEIKFHITVKEFDSSKHQTAPHKILTPEPEECAGILAADVNLIYHHAAGVNVPVCPVGWLDVGDGLCLNEEFHHEVNFEAATGMCERFGASLIPLDKVKAGGQRSRRSSDDDDDDDVNGDDDDGKDGDVNDDDDDDDDDVNNDDDDDEKDDDVNDDDDDVNNDNDVNDDDGDNDGKDDPWKEVNLLEAEGKIDEGENEDDGSKGINSSVSNTNDDGDNEKSDLDEEDDDDDDDDKNSDNNNNDDDDDSGDFVADQDGLEGKDAEKVENLSQVEKNVDGNESESENEEDGDDDESDKINKGGGRMTPERETYSEEEKEDMRYESNNLGGHEATHAEGKAQSSKLNIMEHHSLQTSGKSSGRACLKARLGLLTGKQDFWVSEGEDSVNCLTYNVDTEAVREEMSCVYTYHTVGCLFDANKYKRPTITKFHLAFAHLRGEKRSVNVDITKEGYKYHQVGNDVNTIVITCEAGGWPVPEVAIVQGGNPSRPQVLYTSPLTLNVSEIPGDFLGRFSCVAGNMFGDEKRLSDLTILRHGGNRGLLQPRAAIYILLIVVVVSMGVLGLIFYRYKHLRRLRFCSCDCPWIPCGRRRPSGASRVPNEIFPVSLTYNYNNPEPEEWADELPLYVQQRRGRMRTGSKEPDTIYKELKDQERVTQGSGAHQA